MIIKYKKAILIWTVLALAFFLRIYNLPRLSMYGDELTLVYDSYSLLKTGKDQLGESFPLTFRMGAGRPAGYVYASIPFVYLFGTTELGVRGLSVISGVALVYLIYRLGRRLFSEEVGLVAAFLTSISPAGLSLSRGGFEANFALLLATLGTLLFLDYKKRHLNLLVAIIVWGIAINTYPTYKIVLPVFGLVLVLVTGGIRLLLKIDKKILAASIFLTAIFALSLLYQTFFGISEHRFKEINIFSNPVTREEIVQKINYERTHTFQQGVLPIIFFNKPVEYANLFLTNYLRNYSTEYLFLTGDLNPRHNMTESGLLFWAEIITVAYGLFMIAKDKESTLFKVILGWLFISTLGTAFVSGPHTLRNAFILPPLILMSAYGLTSLAKRYGKFAFILILFILGQFIFLYHRLVYLSPAKHADFWSYSAKAAAQYVYGEKHRFDYVFFSDKIKDAEYAYQAYNKVDPLEVISNNTQKAELNGYNFKRFDNVYIGQVPSSLIDQFLTSLPGSVLYVGNYDKAEDNQNGYQSFNSIDGGVAFVYKKIDKR